MKEDVMSFQGGHIENPTCLNFV